MNTQADVQQKIESYLTRVRKGLRGIREEDASEIVEELRSHFLDKIAGPQITPAEVDAALAALGSPEQLAGEYMTDDMLARVQSSRSPWRILQNLFRWGTLSVAGFFIFIVCFFGYTLSAVLMWCAVLKPVFPATDGLWVSDGADGLELSLHLGFGTPSAGSHEVLGWWLVPIGLVGGYALLMLTSRFVLWCVRRYRKSRKPLRP
jgi:hypothetical protein